jgi:hypothetical protein
VAAAKRGEDNFRIADDPDTKRHRSGSAQREGCMKSKIRLGRKTHSVGLPIALPGAENVGFVS